MPDKPPTPRLSFTGQLVSRLGAEVERRMDGLSGNDMKAIIAWLEKWQIDLAIQKSVEDNHLEVLKGSGKQEVILDLLEDAHSWLGKTAKAEESTAGRGDEDERTEE